MNCAPILGIRAWIVAGTGNTAVFSAYFGTLEFHASFRNFNAITAHAKTTWTDWYTILVDGKVIFINRWSSAFAIKVNEWCDVLTLEIQIIRHGMLVIKDI